MEYRIRIQPRAERDLAELYHYLDVENSPTAARWYKELKVAILTLATDPFRCPIIPENPRYRHLLYGRRFKVYRVIFRIIERENVVEILTIRHGRQTQS